MKRQTPNPGFKRVERFEVSNPNRQDGVFLSEKGEYVTLKPGQKVLATIAPTTMTKGVRVRKVSKLLKEKVTKPAGKEKK